MKLVARALVLGICAVGATAALASSHSATAANLTVSHQTTSSAMPIPNCNPSGCTK